MVMRNAVRRVAAILSAVPLAVMLLPPLVAAHSELQTSDPAEGSTVPSPYSGPIVLTFSEHLASGSKADLADPSGATVAKAVVDPNAKTMTLTPTTPLSPGAWEVRWVSVADDGDLLRGIVKFTVAAAASAAVTASPDASLAPSASAAPASATPSAAPSTAPSPSSSPSGAGTDTGGGGDVVLPIIVALIVLAAGAAYLLTRRNRPGGPTSPTDPSSPTSPTSPTDPSSPTSPTSPTDPT
jgi:methionine-rich copper-binding protein CopC